MRRSVTLCEVGPRDGLQNEARVLPPEIRADLSRRLIAAGLRRVEVASFVSATRVPQMADAEAVVAAVQPPEGAVLAGLVLNERGCERALASGLRAINYAFPVTESFCQRNQGQSVSDAIDSAKRVADRCREAGAELAVYLAAAFGCPYEGPVPPERVLATAEMVLGTGPDVVYVADTIGVGVPTQVQTLPKGLQNLGASRVGCHFHDTRNTGVANAVAALDCGVDVLDSSVGGAGGCPFAPGATGNVATEDLVYVLDRMGVDTGVDIEAVIAVARWLGEQLGKDLPSHLARAGDFGRVQRV
jgi:isopropylmalate/homocitrate/citramalate synthase